MEVGLPNLTVLRAPLRTTFPQRSRFSNIIESLLLAFTLGNCHTVKSVVTTATNISEKFPIVVILLFIRGLAQVLECKPWT